MALLKSLEKVGTYGDHLIRQGVGESRGSDEEEHGYEAASHCGNAVYLHKLTTIHRFVSLDINGLEQLQH